MSSSHTRSIFGLTALALATILQLSFLAACGGGNKPLPSHTPLMILDQPQNATVPVGQTASFTVVASGSASLTYQWKENGNKIDGAVSPTYSLSNVTSADANAVFTVTVSDGTSNLTSASATLSVGPRSPAAGDLRFQLVDSAETQSSLSATSAIRFTGNTSNFQTNSVISPLQLGEGLCLSGVVSDCAWGIVFYAAPASLSITAGYSSAQMAKFDADLKATSSNTVVTTMDMEPGNDVFAVGYLQEPGMDFPAQGEAAPLNGLQAAASADGMAGRVITAISFDGSGDLRFVSYGWSEDTNTTYETEVETAPLSGIEAAASTLANDGYIITAFGGNPSNGYVMVGTKVKGDSIPRPILVFPPTPAGTSTVGYATVAEAESLSDSANPNGIYLFVYEK